MRQILVFKGARRALTMATIAFSANFSIWVLYAILAVNLSEKLSLSAIELGLFFAAPMFTGAVLMIPAGMLAHRFNPKHLYSLQMLSVIPALLILPYVETLKGYITLGLWIGISGTSFTIGISYITDWFDRSRQGSALGIFGIGNAGAAITFIATPIIADHLGWRSVGSIYAAGLAVIAILFMILAPTHPEAPYKKKRHIQKISVFDILCTLKIWRLGLYYYFVFGSFLALILWLPQYYVSVYGLSIKQAMAFTLVFATTSGMVRALGGWFADKHGGRSVNWVVFWVCLVCLFFLSYPPTTMIIHGVNSDVHLAIKVNVWLFSGLIFVIGVAQGFGRASVYKTIHDNYPNHMGVAGGIVSAIGALGGCSLPIAFGLAVDTIGIHTVCFMLLYGLLACCMVVMFFTSQAARLKERVKDAEVQNFLEE